jgi:hypothetical protein
VSQACANRRSEVQLSLSYSGGLCKLPDLLLAPFKSALAQRARGYGLVAARLPPDAGAAALRAVKLAGTPLDAVSIATLEAQLPPATGA